MEAEQRELERIEYKKKTWRSDFIKDREIWLEIAMQINSTKGKKQKYWIRVMDLYNKKYKKDER